MEGEGKLIELVSRLNGKVVVSSDVSDADLKKVDMESLVAAVLERLEGGATAVLGKRELDEIIFRMGEKKEPVQIEIMRSSDFSPAAKEVESSFKIRDARVERATSSVSDFTSYFQDRFTRIREMFRSYGNGLGGLNGGIEGIKQYMNGRELTVVGMVYDKIVTKNGHVLVTLEDESGTAKVLFLRPSRRERDPMNELFDAAMRLVRDDVVAVRGKVSSPFVIANRLLWPDVPIHQMGRCDDDIAIALVSDVHVGHKLFMEKQFGKFLEWINGGVDNRKELAGKVKYMVIAGDLVDGIGVYPGQDRELAIDDIYKQYSVFFDFLVNIPEYIEVFVAPGNHDAVQRAEPQPQIGSNFMKDFRQKNIHMVANPSYLNLHGIKVLEYHGTSLDSVIQGVQGCTYAAPAEAMKEILKRRHLSPIYGGNVIVPSKNDSLVIDEIPDILHMGHIHKNGYAEYHGTTIINSGTWQERTGYQLKQGHVPSPAMQPIYEAATMRTTLMDFNTV